MFGAAGAHERMNMPPHRNRIRSGESIQGDMVFRGFFWNGDTERHEIPFIETYPKVVMVAEHFEYYVVS